MILKKELILEKLLLENNRIYVIQKQKHRKRIPFLQSLHVSAPSRVKHETTYPECAIGSRGKIKRFRHTS